MAVDNSTKVWYDRLHLKLGAYIKWIRAMKRARKDY